MPQHLWADGCRALVRQLGLAALLASAAGPVIASTFVAGTVFQLERGRRSPLAKVTVIARSPGTKEILATARTDDRGRFELRRDFSGKVSFSARKHGYFVKTAAGRPDSEIVLECYSANDCGSVNFEMGRAAVVSGRVVGEYGDPMESVEIVMKPDNGDGISSRVEGATQTDDRGLFRISGVKPGRYRLAARAGYVYGDNTQSRGEAAQVEVDEGGFISGIRIVLAPVEGRRNAASRERGNLGSPRRVIGPVESHGVCSRSLKRTHPPPWGGFSFPGGGARNVSRPTAILAART